MKVKTPQKTEDEFQKLINNSGHNFHLDIVNLLKKNEWIVDISPYYYDDSAEKPREIDIVATKPVFITQDGPPKYNIFLFIECKCLDGEVVFWMDEVDKKGAQDVIRHSIVNLDINQQDTFQENHYLKLPKVAKLFETKQKEKRSNQDVIFSAFTQSIKSLIFFRREKNYASGIYYPIVVYKPKNKIAVYSEKDVLKYNILNEKEIILEVNHYSFKDEVGQMRFDTNQKFFVDFIAEKDFEAFLKVALYNDIAEINEILKFKSGVRPIKNLV